MWNRILNILISTQVDAAVAPPEGARHYTEKLVYLPGSYQVNDYERHVALPRLGAAARDRAAHGLPPPPAVVFCNFNKNDKNDPVSFAAWMNMLRRVPGSVLWMLRPSKDAAFADVRARLAAEAAARGVHPSRLVWAGRAFLRRFLFFGCGATPPRAAAGLPKAAHLQRHAAADLLVDTLVYGARSTGRAAIVFNVTSTCLRRPSPGLELVSGDSRAGRGNVSADSRRTVPRERGPRGRPRPF